jgi:ApbE superfamily uncharacterized protein (UPF0280 family)
VHPPAGAAISSPSGAQRRRLPDGRWHFHHGPIDCIIGAEGAPLTVAAALEQAWLRFAGVLDELVGELALLRTDLSTPQAAALRPQGVIAQRMLAACREQALSGRFITAMAAVAGSVAQELIAYFHHPSITRAYVNNGGDIALHLQGAAVFDVGLVAIAQPLMGVPELDGRFRVTADSPVRGIATSGWRGRSFSLGIADSVTVLAHSAAQADAAATIIANAVDVEDPRILRRPADSLRDDSDLGSRPVTCEVPHLSARQVEQALKAGAQEAQAQIAAGRVIAVALCLQGSMRRCAASAQTAPQWLTGPQEIENAARLMRHH